MAQLSKDLSSEEGSGTQKPPPGRVYSIKPTVERVTDVQGKEMTVETEKLGQSQQPCKFDPAPSLQVPRAYLGKSWEL